MAEVALIRTHWSGTSGGPGLTQTAVFNASGALLTQSQAQAAHNAVRAFWDAIKANLPDEIVLTVDPVVDMYDTANGELGASVTVNTPSATVTGTSTQNYSMAAGVKANLITGIISNGRRVKGAIYIVPTTSGAFSANGLVSSTTTSAINTAGATLISAMATAGLNLGVWSRPRTTPTTREGFVSVVSNVQTNEKTAVLRGRRD